MTKLGVFPKVLHRSCIQSTEAAFKLHNRSLCITFTRESGEKKNTCSSVKGPICMETMKEKEDIES